ncbi:hypothetical protein Hanom_Chr10g00875721 [Helianthus anomalus]
MNNLTRVHFSFRCHFKPNQWWTQKLFARGADKEFNHIFKGCSQVFCLKYTLNFLFKGCGRPPTTVGRSATEPN